MNSWERRRRRLPRRGTQLTFQHARLDRGHGGPRTGAGRKPIYARPPVHHVGRPRLAAKYPCHVRLRVRDGVPSLRTKGFLKAFRKAIAPVAERSDFRVVHYSVQRNHVHLLVEAHGKEALGRGMKAVGTRFALCVKAVYGIPGRVLFGRYWLRILRTAKEVRNALAYVLLNARKHFAERFGKAPPTRLDVCSSGRWFDGWRRAPPLRGDALPEACDVSSAHTWLLSRGWRRYALIDPAEVPGGSRLSG